MSVRTTAQADALYTRHGRPPIGKAIPLALQHVVAMVVGCITMPMIVASSAGVSSRTRSSWYRPACWWRRWRFCCRRSG